MILWSIMPRRDKFEAPGPLLQPTEQPRLFHELQSIAGDVGQAMPTEVYLVNDVNAWVSQRGGWMGVGSSRVMGLGLPLMALLKVSEFRGVLAHEFGHYHGGDTKLGPWVYKTRDAIGRTLENLSNHSSLLKKPFAWYGRLFLRLTHAVSRHQELAADALAADLVGSRAMIEGLKKVHSSSRAFEAFWQSEAVPVLSAGYRPPLTLGFSRFLSQGDIQRSVSRSLQNELAEAQANPYDTHPPLPQRIAALESLPPGESKGDEPFAISLLENIPDRERELLASVADAETVGRLKNLDWEQVGDQVYLPQWRRRVAQHAGSLSGVTPASLIEHAKDLERFAQAFAPEDQRGESDEAVIGYAQHVVGAAMAVWLSERGVTMHCEPGAPISFQAGEASIHPFGALTDLADGSLAANDWLRQVTAFDLADVDLGQDQREPSITNAAQ
jgi:Zn-dependent protease with chaperone function